MTTSSLLEEVPRRYVEQLQTTVETMRRRCIAIYDGTLRLGHRAGTIFEKTRETVEPAAYDVRDFLVNAVNNLDPLPEKNRELRNNLQEMYLGISVLLIGLACGVISGATFLGALFSHLLNPFVELAALIAVPAYVHYQSRKNAGIDETERRVWLFGIAYFMGSVFGHAVGPRLLSTVPAVLFVMPLVLGLLIDYELGPKDLFADRQRLLMTAGAAAGVLAYFGSFMVTGVATAPLLAIVVQCSFLFVHFQITVAAEKGSLVTPTDLQFGYVVSALLLQTLVAFLFGNPHFGLPPPVPQISK